MNNAKTLNRKQAILAMFEGKIVRPVEPLYLSHQRPAAFRWNDSTQQIEWCQYPDCRPDDWKWSQRSFFYLASEFLIDDPNTTL